MKYVWAIYIGLLLILGFGRMVQKIITETGGFGSRYGPAIAATIIAIGVFGYVFQRQIARNWFWKAVFWLLATASAGLLAFVVCLLFSVGSGSFRLVGLIMVVLLVLSPAQRQLFGYAYRSPQLWGIAPNNSINTNGRNAPAG